jgi:hypothetical protein
LEGKRKKGKKKKMCQTKPTCKIFEFVTVSKQSGTMLSNDILFILKIQTMMVIIDGCVF